MARWFTAVAASAALLLSAGSADAQLSINRLWLDFEPGSAPRSDLVIRNDSSDRYYITVQPYEITAPGTPAEARVTMADPDQLGLLVTPNRLILEPGASRSIRVVSLNEELTQDRIYRVLITPQVGNIAAGERAPDDSELAIKVLAAYDVLVVARPRQIEPQLEVNRAAQQVVIRNTGNSNVLLFDGRACPTEDAAENDPACRQLPSTRLYPGADITIPLEQPTDRVIFRERRTLSSQPVVTRF